MKKTTELLYAGRNPDRQAGAVNPAVYRASTIVFPSFKDMKEAEAGKFPNAFEEARGATTADPWYGIAGTPTTFALQDVLKKLEKADDCLITSSGLEAITLTLQSFLQSGDHLLMVDSVYGPTRRFCNKFLTRFGVETTYYDPTISGAGIAKLIRKNTRLIFMESPGSLTFEMQDVEAITAVAKKHLVLTALDSSWATPLYFNPLEHGVDICIQVPTKYIAGHSDVLLGAVLTRGDTITPLLQTYRNLGISTSPDDCWLALRGLRSLAARMERHQRSTDKIIAWLEKRKEVRKILYPAHPKDPGHGLWKKYCTGAASLFTIILDKDYTLEQVSAILDKMELFAIGYSWGGFESLIISFDPAPIRTATRWQEKGTCIRLYIGLEDADDLIADLEKGFKRLGATVTV